MRRVVILVGVISCGGSQAQPPTDAVVDVDAFVADAQPDATPMVRVFGNVNYNGGVVGIPVITITSPIQTNVTDDHGDFYFDVPDGSPLIYKAVPADPAYFPMIRGVVAHDHIRPRVLYLLGPSDVAAAQPLGVTFDAAHAIVETDFRNAAIGGYAVQLLSASNQTVSPTYGIVYDAGGEATLGQATVTGGDGSTLLLGGLPQTSVSFVPTVPQAATLPCQPRDLVPLPLEPGVVTWFDFECGSGTD